MEVKTVSTEQDKKALLAIVEEMSKSTTGAQSTKQWAPEAIWFDVPPFASMGVEPARKQFDKEFGAVSSFVAEILRTEIVVNGDMGIVCSVQRWSVVDKSGIARPPMLIRATDCFERRDGRWRVIHEHSSLPTGGGWDGTIQTGD